MKDLDKQTIEKLEKGGFIRSKFRPYGKIYETFEEFRKSNNYQTSVEMTSEKCNACKGVIENAVAAFRRMEK